MRRGAGHERLAAVRVAAALRQLRARSLCLRPTDGTLDVPVMLLPCAAGGGCATAPARAEQPILNNVAIQPESAALPTHIILDLRDMKRRRIGLLSIRELSGLLKFLARYHSAREWVDANGGYRAVAAVCREAQSRRCCSNRTRVFANQLAPPACRCGKAGTLYLGFETFCRACGPPPQARELAQKATQAREEKCHHWDQIKKENDRNIKTKTRDLAAGPTIGLRRGR